ncbi:carboxy methyl transferase for protein phosphatase 2A [Gnomoniopsis sp. IMI 355080]|nr:carboxy methyl transferase for protein phosphatase 2A [Gnomoniopsis sp. IMI 355080]
MIRTYTRTISLDRLVDSFLSGNSASDGEKGERQIISLGAGTDTRSFRLFSQKNRRRPLIYHEVDFPAISNRKRMIIQATPSLRKVIRDPEPVEEGGATGSWRGAPEGNGNRYWCHGLDLRDLARDPRNGQGAATSHNSLLAGLRTDVPTLLVSECCLCYLETHEANRVVQYFVDRIPDLGLVLYEPVKPDDPFGRQMVSNLAARGIKMPTLEDHKEPRDQEQRLRQAGFTKVEQKTVDKLWERWVSTEEKERLDALEGLDEVEEWHLLAAHYIVAWGSRGEGFGDWLTLETSPVS